MLLLLAHDDEQRERVPRDEDRPSEQHRTDTGDRVPREQLRGGRCPRHSDVLRRLLTELPEDRLGVRVPERGDRLLLGQKADRRQAHHCHRGQQGPLEAPFW